MLQHNQFSALSALNKTLQHATHVAKSPGGFMLQNDQGLQAERSGAEANASAVGHLK